MRWLGFLMLYLAVGALWIFGVLDTGVLDGREALMWTCLALFGLGHAAFGFAFGRWISLLFPNVLVVLALPAGYAESLYEPPPVWVWQLWLAPFLTTLVAAGLGARGLTGRRRSAGSASDFRGLLR